MEDECDFDTLAAMLDDDVQEASSAGTSAAYHNDQQQQQGQEDSDDDDDDIDDDELDKLAEMVANDDLATRPSSAEMNRIESIDRQTSKTALSSNCQSANQANVQTNDDVCELQAKIRQLEAQLLQSQQQQTQKQPVVCKQPADENTKPTQKLSKNCTSAGLPQCRDKKAPPKLREIEEDIFFASDVSCPREKRKRTAGDSSVSSGPTVQIPKDDSGSDWDDMDGEKPSNLSESGKELNALIRKETGQRVAHTTNFTERPPSSTWKQKPVSAAAAKSAPSKSAPSKSAPDKSASNKLTTHTDNKDLMTEPFSGLRIIKPLVSSAQMKARMTDRRMIRISRLKARGSTADMDGDWVTIGVVISKSDTKTSANGKQYCLWKLSDLEDCDQPVSFFLFGESYKQHWKVVTGTVVGILNASIMQNSEKYQNSTEMSLTIDHPQKVMVLGTSKDMGKCRATTKAGRDCTSVINTQKGEYCTYHVQSAYKKISSKRAELQAGHTGVTPKSFERKLFGRGGGNAVMYGGHAYMTSGHTGKSKKSVSIKSLQHHHSTNKPGQLTTLSLHQLLPEDKDRLDKLNETKDDKFHDLLTTPSVGAVNFVKHLVKKEERQITAKTGVTVQSVSASDLLKAHTATMKQRQQERKAKQVAPSVARNGTIQSDGPQIGRGCVPGGSISFDFDDSSLQRLKRPKASAQCAKERAIARVKGGLEKKDPNAIRSQNTEERQEQIRKRLVQQESGESEVMSTDDIAPPTKRSRLLGDLDLNSSDVQRVLNANSAHAGALTEEAMSRQEQYFNVLEKREQMEQKMSSVQQMKCKVVSCKKCNYTAFSASDLCKQAGHTVTTHDAQRRFFQCKDCKCRTTSFFKYPTKPCSRCNGSSFEKTSMYKEKKGPETSKDEFEKNMRGEERKFINSMNC